MPINNTDEILDDDDVVPTPVVPTPVVPTPVVPTPVVPTPVVPTPVVPTPVSNFTEIERRRKRNLGF